jgi:hypothetical protein
MENAFNAVRGLIVGLMTGATLWVLLIVVTLPFQ